MSRIDDLKGYKELLDQGVITEEEFQSKKQEILSKQEEPEKTVETKGASDFIQSVKEVPNATGQVGNKSKIAAGLFGIFFGYFGVHNFYLGYTSKAILQLVLTILSLLLCVVFIGIIGLFAVYIWTFVEGIMILTSSKGSRWHLDAVGNELRD